MTARYRFIPASAPEGTPGTAVRLVFPDYGGFRVEILDRNGIWRRVVGSSHLGVISTDADHLASPWPALLRSLFPPLPAAPEPSE